MLRSGKDYLTAIRDGRQVYIGGELVDDVTTHPAFAGSAATVAKLYDLSSTSSELQYVEKESGQVTNVNFLRPRSREDLAARRRLHEAWADVSCGLFGRSPDHVAGFITGMACAPEIAGPYADNILEYWRYVRDNDLFLSYAVLPPAGSKGVAQGVSEFENALRLVSKDATGVTVHGFKMLATGGPLCDEILVGNMLPLRPGDEALATTFAVPANHPGVKILSRKAYPMHSSSQIDDPLAAYDETDAAIFFDNVHVPWNRVFVLDDISAGQRLFHATPAHTLGNAQAHIRLRAKMRFMLGVAKKFGDRLGFTSNPAVRGTFGGLAARVSVIDGMITAQEYQPEAWPNGFVTQDRELMYSTMNWSMEYFPEFATEIRRFMGSHVFQQPADVSSFDNEYTRKLFLEFNRTDDFDTALENYKIVKLLWDLVGSELASRNFQYELFYAGPPHITRARVYDHFGWESVTAPVERMLAETDFHPKVRV